MKDIKNITALLLCAGKGSRMQDESRNKVTFPVAGVPAVQRTAKNMAACGIDRFIAVLGHLPQSVMDALSCFDGVAYAYQKEQNGTGGAAYCGLCALKTLGVSGSVIISMGDKVIANDTVSELLEKYIQSDKNTVFAVTKKENNPGGGRILMRDGRIFGIYEATDAALLLLGSSKEHTEEAYKALLDTTNLNEGKKKKVLSYALEHMGQLPSYVTFAGESFSYEDIEAMPYVNTAFYIADIDEITEAIADLGDDNAQGEIYLTDALNQLILKSGADIYIVEERDKLLSFSTKAELEEISRYYLEKDMKI